MLKGDAAGDDGIVRRVSAAEIEAAVVDQVRALLRQPEVVVGTWLAARAEAPDLTEGEVAGGAGIGSTRCGTSCSRPSRRGSCGCWWSGWMVGPAGADIRLRVEGLAGLVRDLGADRARRAEGGGMSDGDQHHGPGAAGHPAAAGAEDGGDAGAASGGGGRCRRGPIRRW